MIHSLRDAPTPLKVAAAPLFSLLCLLVFSGIALVVHSELRQSLVSIGNTQVERILVASELNEQVTAVRASVNLSLAWEGAGFKAQKIEQLDKKILKELVQYQQRLEQVRQADKLSETERELLDEAIVAYGKYITNARYALDIKTGMLGNAASYMTTMDSSYAAIKSALNQLVLHQSQQAKSTVDRTTANAYTAQTRLLWVAAAALLTTAGIAWYMSRLIVRPLTDARRVAESVARGDLTARPTEPFSADATGHVLTALDNVAHGLSSMVNEIRQTAHRVNLAATDITSGCNQMLERGHDSVQALQQTMVLMDTLSSSVNRSAQHAAQADHIAQEASTIAQRGGTVVGEVVQLMQGIAAQSKKIDDIVGVIDDIAFQTNILALNASVEAARAGEHGRGFSVVATEVQNLARRSADAAKEVRVLVNASASQVQAGAARAEVAGLTMGDVVKASERASGTVRSISSSAEEQNQQLTQVTQAMQRAQHHTQQNARLVSEASRCAELLDGQARVLVKLLDRFRTDS